MVAVGGWGGVRSNREVYRTDKRRNRERRVRRRLAVFPEKSVIFSDLLFPT